MNLKKKIFSAKTNLDFWEEKISLLTNYLAVTKSLNAKSSLNDFSEILNLLNQRQEIIKEMSSLDDQTRKITTDEEEIVDIGDKSGNEFLSIPQRTKKILSEIEYFDNQLKEKFISWREEVKKELMTNQLTFKTIHTYAQTFSHQAMSRFLDMRK